MGSISVPRGASRGLIQVGSVPVQPPAISGTANTWVNVTPVDMSLDPDDAAVAAKWGSTGNNFGCQGVRCDQSRPGVFYAGATYQGLWKSIDYGLTWTKLVQIGTDIFGNGRLNFVIAPDGSYALSTCLYPVGGVSNGAWRSTDYVHWTRTNIGFDNGDDVGRFAICPTAGLRVMASAHSGTEHMWESRDGGLSWTDQGAIGTATGAEIIWVDENTLLGVSDGDNVSGNGTWRGVRSGSVWPWTWTWTSVDTQQHWHGTAQAYIDPSTGFIWTGGGFGIRKSTDHGLTWSQVSANNSAGVVATSKTLFATSNYASTVGFGPDLCHADLAAGGTSWTNDTTPTGSPSNMTNGWLYAAVQTDGVKYAVVGGNWNAGIWRYVET